MAKIELNNYDLIIRPYKDHEDGSDREVVQIASRLAFDSDFIEDMKSKGVKTVVNKNTEEEKEEDNQAGII